MKSENGSFEKTFWRRSRQKYAAEPQSPSPNYIPVFERIMMYAQYAKTLSLGYLMKELELGIDNLYLLCDPDPGRGIAIPYWSVHTCVMAHDRLVMR